MRSILELTALELGRRIKKKEIGVEEAAKTALAQMRVLEPELNCYVTVDERMVLDQAQKVQKKIDDGELTGPLAGVPAAIKDNLCIEGLPATCSSRILENFMPSYTAEAVVRLLDGGAVILGKTNMDEFAMGSTTETSAFGATRIHGIQSMCREDLREAPAGPWLPMNVFMHWGQTQEAPSASPAPSAG